MTKCLACQSEKTTLFISVAGNSPGEYYLCQCGAAFLDPVPNDLTEWYASGAYRMKTGTDDPWHKLAKKQEQDRAVYVSKIVKQMKITSHLDIGCSTGDLLAAVAQDHPNITSIGVDIDPVLTTTDYTVYKSIDEVTDKYDLITMIQTLEHLPNPQWWMKKIYTQLNHGGMLIVEVPNRRANMTAYVVPQHVVAYDVASLRHVMGEFRLMETTLHGYPEMSPLDLHILQVATK